LAAALSALVATTSLTVVLVSRPAAADQIAGLKAQATAISQKLIEDQLQIGAFQQQYSVASEKVAADARAIAQIGQQIIQDEQQMDKETGVVRKLAITSYMNGAALSGSEAMLFAGDVEAAQSADEYSAIATGNIVTALDQLQAAQGTLQAHQATLRQQQAQDQSDQTQQATDLRQADSTEQQMASEQSLVTGQLAVAITVQAAAADTAAAAAVAGARKAAGKAPASGGTSASGTSASGISATGSDPALNPFLRCVVRAESGGNYGAVSPNGLYMGAFQFSQPTWNFAARAAGLSSLVGVPPNHASKADQDALAVVLYALDGRQPWLGDRCSA
jgi:peptidoglycan hydrolase CwlO-like protein